ncbi:hypothetical protein MVEN_00153900 [Mycena venus]|uniref:DUF6534 domain-containing protein n=1 Tax=Mycena venus TaxID=2733690 RepID=A0A8H6YWD9_9AGAR|nr:hypothetical protein MVEN_00153900 [Mycena venus]
MLEIFLAFHYFRRKGRMFWHKAGVVAFIISDTACTVGVCAEVYVALIESPSVDFQKHYADATLLWQASLTVIATYTTASVEQAFLCYIFYALTNRRFISGFFVLTIFVHLGISLAAAGLVAEAGLVAKARKIAMTHRVSEIGAISCAATDILVAAALAVTFHKMEASVTRGRTMRSLIRRLLILSLTSGVIVASFTIIHMVLLLVNNPASTIIFFCQGRAYALTLLSNFLLGVPVDSAVSPANDTSPLSIPGSQSITTPPETFSLHFRTRSQSGNTSSNNNINIPKSPSAPQDKSQSD